jgi:hypothetical protein
MAQLCTAPPNGFALDVVVDGDMQVSPDLVLAYERALYVVHWPGAVRQIVFGDVLTAADVPLPCRARFAIVTADNPFSRPTAEATNKARRDALERVVDAVGRAWVLSEGRDPNGLWPTEHGVAVIDPTDHELDDWMMRFGKNVVLDVPLGQPIRLRMHPDVSAARRS